MGSLFHSNTWGRWARIYTKKGNSNWFTIVLGPDSAEGRAVSLFVEFGDRNFRVLCVLIRWLFGLFCLGWLPVYQRQNPEMWTRTAGRCDVTVAFSCRRWGSHQVDSTCYRKGFVVPVLVSFEINGISYMRNISIKCILGCQKYINFFFSLYTSI